MSLSFKPIANILSAVFKIGGRAVNGIGTALTALQAVDWGLKKTRTYELLFSRLKCTEPKCAETIPDELIEKTLEKAENDEQKMFVKCPYCEYGGARINQKEWKAMKYWKDGDMQGKIMDSAKKIIKK